MVSTRELRFGQVDFGVWKPLVAEMITSGELLLGRIEFVVCHNGLCIAVECRGP
jgi:hypothetical protein